MQDKCFIVSGASSGIGLAVTKLLLKKGANVIAVARNQVELADSYDMECCGKLRSLQCDLSEFDQLNLIMATLVKEDPALDGIIMCHGYGDFGGLEEFSTKRILRLINTNLTSNILITRHIIPRFKRLCKGDIIFIGSEAGLRGSKMGAVYCAAKFALRGFAESLRQECAGANLRVSIINPGMVNTSFFDALEFSPGESRDNFIEADDVAEIVTMILSLPQGTVVDQVNLSPQKRVVRKKSVTRN